MLTQHGHNAASRLPARGKTSGGNRGEASPPDLGKESECVKRQREHTYMCAPEAPGSGNLRRGNKSRLRNEEQIHSQSPLCGGRAQPPHGLRWLQRHSEAEAGGIPWCSQQSPCTGQDELAGHLLQSGGLLQLQRLFWVWFVKAGRDYLLTPLFPTPALGLSCKGKLVAAA